MTDQDWAQATTPQKLDWLRQEADRQRDFGNRLSWGLKDLENRVTAQVLPMVDQIGDLSARVTALETAAAQRSG